VSARIFDVLSALIPRIFLADRVDTRPRRRLLSLRLLRRAWRLRRKVLVRLDSGRERESAG
jgi:hypothetical protein